MRIVKTRTDQKETITLRLSSSVIKAVTELAQKNGISRQELIEAILRKSLRDKNLVIEV